MLRDEDIRIQWGRCVGGTFVSVTHIPTGLTRSMGPLDGNRPHQRIREWLREIEGELAERGLDRYILPDRRPRRDELSG